MDWTIILTAFFTFLAGGGGKWIYDLIKQKGDVSLQQQKQASELKLSETEKAFVIYKEIVDSLKHDVAGLTNSMQIMEKEYIAAREKNAESSITIQNQKEVIMELRAQLANKK